MHEISLVRNIFSTLEHEFEPQKLDKLKTITLNVGKLSNVEPVLMQNAFEAVTTAENKYREVELRVNVLPVKIFCESCEKESTIDNYKFVCSQCMTPNNNIIQGTELLIHQVEFDSQ